MNNDINGLFTAFELIFFDFDELPSGLLGFTAFRYPPNKGLLRIFPSTIMRNDVNSTIDDFDVVFAAVLFSRCVARTLRSGD